MAAQVGDKQFDHELFDSTGGVFSGILRTTWELLEQNNWVKRFRIAEFHLTAEGWIEALRASGVLCDPTMKEDLVKMSANMQAICKAGGRHQDSPTLQDVAAKTGLSEAFIRNAVEAHLIRECLNQEDCEWEPGDEYMKNHIMIPARFGKSLTSPA